MDKRKKYFRAVTVALLLIAFSGYGKNSDRAFRMQVVRMIAGEGMIRLVEAQYVGKSRGRENRSYEEAEQKAGNIGSVQKKYGQKAADPVAETLSDRKDNEDRPRAALTFDDGPSKNTAPILEILDKEQVPATFFVCAQDANEKYLPLVADIAAAGHQIALHSATHQYSKIYASTDAFWQDIRTLRQALEPYVDVAAIDWLRFPGGSTNTVSHRYGGNGIMKTLKAQAEDKGYHWIDWNVCAEDATASHPDAAQILRNIRRDADGQDTCVVLLHDTKATGQTVKALPDMIAYFREQGYNFCTVAQMDALQCETK